MVQSPKLPKLQRIEHFLIFPLSKKDVVSGDI